LGLYYQEVSVCLPLCCETKCCDSESAPDRRSIRFPTGTSYHFISASPTQTGIAGSSRRYSVHLAHWPVRRCDADGGISRQAFLYDQLSSTNAPAPRFYHWKQNGCLEKLNLALS